MKYIYYIGNFDFYLFNAQAQLVLSNGRIFKELGYQVIYIGSSNKERYSKLSDTKVNVDGFPVYMGYFSKRIKDLIEWKKLDDEIIELLEENVDFIEAVVLYGSPGFAIQVSSLSRWCKNNSINFIANCVDISSTSHGNIIERIAKTTDRKLRDLIFKTKADGIIAVSKYIAKYFNKNNSKPVVIIPPLRDCNLMTTPQMTSTNLIKIVYAGIPFPVDGRKVDVSAYKDRLDIVLDLIGEIYKYNKSIRLDIYGLNEKQYLKVVNRHIPLMRYLSNIVYFHGVQNSEKIIQKISKADFTINLRNVNQMTTAGFSTKFVESISCGTPVITTNTSDLSNYLIEGRNGFFVNIDNKEDAVNKLLEIFSLKPKNIQKMKKYCFDSRLFDYREYVDEMKHFLDSL